MVFGLVVQGYGLKGFWGFGFGVGGVGGLGLRFRTAYIN